MLPSPIDFTKLNSAGNDFVCVDNTTGRFTPLLENPQILAKTIKAICRRGLAVGADGVVFACQIGDGAGIDIVARFFEPDGSEAKLCGNGTACFTYWAIHAGLVPGPAVTILTGAGTAQGRVDDEDPQRIRVCVPDPRNLAMDVAVDLHGDLWTLDLVDTGVPHAIAYVEHLDTLDLDFWGSGIRHHPHFGKAGVNANFVHVEAVGHISVRTFEFGVEAETLACGTGSAAAAILTALRHQWPDEYRRGERPVKVTVRSGDQLLIWFVCDDGQNVHNVCLESVVRPVYNGTLRPEFITLLEALATDSADRE